MKYILFLFLLIKLDTFNAVAQITKKPTDKDAASSAIKGKVTRVKQFVKKNELLYAEKMKISDTLYIYIQQLKSIDTIKSTYKKITHQLDSINKRLYNTGYVFNKLIPQKIILVKKNLHIYYMCEYIERLKIDSISYNTEMPKNVVQYIHKQYSGRNFSQKKIKSMQSFIEENTAYKASEKALILFKGKRNIIHLNLAKKQMNSIDGLVGFGYDNSKNRMSLTGKFDLSVFNIFKGNEQIAFHWQKNNSIQKYHIYINKPFIKGSRIGVNNNFQLIRKDSTELSIYNNFSIEWKGKRHSLSVHFSIDNRYVQNKTNENQNYIGISQLYNIKKRKENSFFNEKTMENNLGFNTNLEINDWYLYNKLNYSFKTTTNQGVKITGINYYASGHNPKQFTGTILNIFRSNRTDLSNLKAIKILKSGYYFVNRKQIFYTIHDFINENTITNETKTYINLGVGIQLLKKNQILTLKLFTPIFLSNYTDNQNVYISIKQSFLF